MMRRLKHLRLALAQATLAGFWGGVFACGMTEGGRKLVRNALAHSVEWARRGHDLLSLEGVLDIGARAPTTCPSCEGLHLQPTALESVK